MNIIAVQVRPSTPPPLDAGLETWARAVILSPAGFGATPAEGRIVAELLADVEAGR
jgi:hypothetical protein